MGYGATVAVQDGEENYRDAVCDEIAERAAALVATGTPRDNALGQAAEELRNEDAAENDPTGTIAAQFPTPAAPDAPRAQVAAIKADLMERASSLAAKF